MAQKPNMERVYVAVAPDDRETPVIADSFTECAKEAVKQFDLRHSLTDPSNWDEAKGGLRAVKIDPKRWRAKVKAQKYGHVSIHKVEK